MKIMNTSKDNLGHKKSEMIDLIPEIKVEESPHRNRRDEITAEIVEGINTERRGTKYRPITAKGVAMKLNTHPATKKDLTQREFILKKCKEIGFNKMFYYYTKIEKNEN